MSTATLGLGEDQEDVHHAPTGVTAVSSVSPVRIRTARSSGTTKILPSPTSPVLPPSARACDRRLDEGVGDRDLEADLVGHADLDGRAAVGLDPVELAAVALDVADRDPAHLGAVEGLEHVIRLLRADDPDDELHVARSPRAARRRRLWPRVQDSHGRRLSARTTRSSAPSGKTGRIIIWGMEASAPERQLIITADDYGYWPSYNEGILAAIEAGAVDAVSAMVEREHCDPRPLLRERGGGRPPHRLRGPLGRRAAAPRPGPRCGCSSTASWTCSAAGPSFLERTPPLPRAAGAGDAGARDGAADRGPGALGQPRPPPVAARARDRHPGPADRAPGQQRAGRAARAARAARRA